MSLIRGLLRNVTSSTILNNSISRTFSVRLSGFIDVSRRFNSTMKPTILVTRSDLPREMVDLLRDSCDVELWEGSGPIPRSELISRAPGKAGLICMVSDKIDAAFLDAAGPALKIVSSYSVGLDHVDIGCVRARGIRIGYTPDVLTDAVAELTIGLLLATARRFFEAHGEMVNNGWKQGGWSPLWMCGRELRNSVVGIVGMGRIGFGILRRLQAFSVSGTLYTSRSRKPNADEIGATHTNLDDLLAKSDFVICSSALTPETTGMFNVDAFKKMKTSAIFINVSRGALVVQEDLIQALKNGEIAAAGLDVMTPEPLSGDDELLTLKNCTVIPHIGSASVETRVQMGLLAARNLINGLKGEPMPAEFKD